MNRLFDVPLLLVSDTVICDRFLVLSPWITHKAQGQDFFAGLCNHHSGGNPGDSTSDGGEFYIFWYEKNGRSFRQTMPDGVPELKLDFEEFFNDFSGSAAFDVDTVNERVYMVTRNENFTGLVSYNYDLTDEIRYDATTGSTFYPDVEIDPDGGYAYFTTFGEVYRYDLNNKSADIELLYSLDSSTGLDIDLDNQKLYATSRNQKEIWWSDLDGSNAAKIIDIPNGEREIQVLQ